MNENYDSTALLALPKVWEGSVPEKGLLSWSRPYLIDKVRENGVDVLVARGADSFDLENDTVTTSRPEYSRRGEEVEVAIQDLGSRALDSFGVVRSIIKRIYPSNSSVPFLNPNSVRELAKDKFDMAHMVLDPTGNYRRKFTYLLPGNNPNEVAEEVACLPGSQVVAKPITGKRSEGVFVGQKSDVIGQFNDGVEKGYLVEEKMNFSVPMPNIRGCDEGEQRRLDAANHNGVNKEFRLFYFGQDEWDGIARIARPGEVDFLDDKWLFVDQDSIPGSLVDRSATIVNRIRQLVDRQDHDFHLAIDWVFASTASDAEPSWRVMEVNAAEPQLVQLTQNLEVGRRQHDKLATQISRIALR